MALVSASRSAVITIYADALRERGLAERTVQNSEGGADRKYIAPARGRAAQDKLNAVFAGF
jgi:hypothetical protein